MNKITTIISTLLPVPGKPYSLTVDLDAMPFEVNPQPRHYKTAQEAMDQITHGVSVTCYIVPHGPTNLRKPSERLQALARHKTPVLSLR